MTGADRVPLTGGYGMQYRRALHFIPGSEDYFPVAALAKRSNR
jgi:hypothetical protein